MPIASPKPTPIAISPQSWKIFQTVMADLATAPFLLKALRTIEQDADRCGRPFKGGPARIDVVALPRDQQLRLFWNPEMSPIEVIIILISL